MATAASAHAWLPVAAAASATADPYMAFHSVRTLSSSPGLTRVARDASRICRPDSTSGSPRRGRTDRPAEDGAAFEVPSAVTPNQSMQRRRHLGAAGRGGAESFGHGGGDLVG